MAVNKTPRIMYLCNGKRCMGVKDCKPRFELDHPGNKRERFMNECCHCHEKEYAKNGRIKGLIDLLIRFEIHFKPYFYLWEKEK